MHFYLAEVNRTLLAKNSFLTNIRKLSNKMHGYLYFYVIHLVNPEIYLKTGLTYVMIHVGSIVCEKRRGTAVTESTHDCSLLSFTYTSKLYSYISVSSLLRTFH